MKLLVGHLGSQLGKSRNNMYVLSHLINFMRVIIQSRDYITNDDTHKIKVNIVTEEEILVIILYRQQLAMMLIFL